jgi:tetratricopeptide (TPR) repeat protein
LLALLDVAVDPSAGSGQAMWRDLDPPQRRQRTLDAVKRLLLRESQAQPLLVVFEDLHWIDSETQALLDNLVESLPTARIFLLVNYRPEYQHGWGNKTYYSQIRIDPLPPESAGELLQALLGDDSNLRPLKQLLIQRTERNPFFLEEIVRTLVETKILTGMRGAYRLTKALEEIQVPATVQVVLAARIDRLPAEEKRLLQSAAVIGERVPFTLLQAVVEMPEEELRRGLGYLQASEFLYETSLFPELEYTFKHGLTHQVAYNSLLHERRRTLHAQLMSAIEILYANRTTEQIERLAHHAFGGELWAKAVVYLREAGSKAMTCSAYREAVSFLEKALVALKHHPEDDNTLEQAVDLRLALRTALFPSGNFGRILAYLREAEALAEALEDPRRLGRVCGFLSQHFYLTGVYDQAIAAAQRALTLTNASGEAVLPALANIHLGRGYEAQGNYHRAIDCFTQTMSAVEGAQRRERFGQVILPAVASRAFRAGCHAELGTFAEGHAVGEEALRIAELVDHPASLMLALWGVGLLALRQGDLARALPLLERAVHICQDAELPVWFPVVAPTLGAAYTLAGRVANAVPLLTRAMATERIAYQGLRVLSLAEAHLLARVLEEAHVLAERALALTREHEERGHQAYALRLLGEITAREDSLDIGKAEDNYRQALAIAEELGMRPLIAHCHVGLGKLYRRINKKEKAKVHLSDGIALMRQMEMGLWLQRAEAELKELA